LLQEDAFNGAMIHGVRFYPIDILKLLIGEESRDKALVVLNLGAIYECQIKVVFHAKGHEVMEKWPRHDDLVSNTSTAEIGDLSRIWKRKEEDFLNVLVTKNKKLFGKGMFRHLSLHAKKR